MRLECRNINAYETILQHVLSDENPRGSVLVWQGNRWDQSHWLEYCSRPLLYCFLGNLNARFGLSRTEWGFVTEFKRARETRDRATNFELKDQSTWILAF